MAKKNFLRTPAEVFVTPVKAGQYGLELELEGENLPPVGVHKHWKNPEQGENSLRKGGLEYITKEPVKFEKLRPYIEELSAFIDQENGVVKHGAYRASTHIHYNCQDIPFKTVLGIVVVYTALEPLFMSLCGEHRNGNLFCVPSYDCGDLPDVFSRWIIAINSNFRDHNWAQRGKYAALNTDPITTLGSIEFRGFPSTISADDVIEWALWIKNIHELVAGQQDASCLELLQLAEGNPTFVQNVLLAPSQRLNQRLHPADPDALLQLGLVQAYELARMLRKAL